MKKQGHRQNKKKSPKKRNAAPKRRESVDSNTKALQKESSKRRPVRDLSKNRRPREKARGDRSIAGYVNKAWKFLRESKLELKKVKWPTRKELLASTAVVIVLTLIIALFLGLVDVALIKTIKSILR